MDYQYVKASVNVEKLKDELTAAIPGKEILGLTRTGVSLIIHVNGSLSGDELDQVNIALAAHSPTDLHAIVRKRVENAMDFGRALIVDYATKRVLRGAGIADTERVLARAAHILASITAGSLYVALDQIEKLQPDSDITSEDLDEFKTKLRAYLGL